MFLPHNLSTDENDIVLDPFCGSGTTLVSAALLNRQYIGIEINPDAIEICKKRLIAPEKTESHLLKVGLDSYKTKNERELAILKQFDCEIVQRNKGIDAFLKKHYNNKPVAIKIQKETESFREALTLLSSAGKRKDCSYLILITQTEGWHNECTDIPSNVIVLETMGLQFDHHVKREFQ